MPLSTTLDRKLRAAEDSSDSEEYYQVTDRSSSASLIETGDGGHIISSDDNEGGSEIEETSDGFDEDQVHARLSNVSFGALTKAQDALSKNSSTGRKRKRGEEGSASQEDKLHALRERLRQIKAEKLAAGAAPSKKAKKPSGKSDHRSADLASEHDHNTDGSDLDGPPHTRSSKHAPAVQSSKRMVSRKRKVVDVKKPVFRDPRFDNVSGPQPDENTIGKRYSFLNDYRASEIADLRTVVKKTKNEDEKEQLKKKLLSMESQEQTRKRKEEQQNVVRDHKKKEKELVQHGKQPFYLKKSEQKKIALVDRFQSMKSKQRDRIIERRRKKATAKERRNMPDERRTAS